MLVALNGEGNRVLAKDSMRGEVFVCPLCKEKVFLKKGRIKIPHFSHYPNSTCNFAGESERHLFVKNLLYELLNPYFSVEIEKVFVLQQKKRIADLYLEVEGHPLVIEFQHSNISFLDLRNRTYDYVRCFSKWGGVLWIFDYSFFEYKKIGLSKYGVWEAVRFNDLLYKMKLRVIDSFLYVGEDDNLYILFCKKRKLSKHTETRPYYFVKRGKINNFAYWLKRNIENICFDTTYLI